MKFHTRYDPPTDAGITFDEPSMTQQHFADECDINKIIERAIKTGDTTVFSSTERGQFYDCTVAKDYTDAMAMINDVNDDFKSLPSRIREMFGNDVSAYVQFMSNPENLQQAVELGLLERSEEVKAPLSPSPEADKPQSGASVSDPAASTAAEPGTSPS